MPDYDRIRSLLDLAHGGLALPSERTELRRRVLALLPPAGLTADQVFCQQLAVQYWAAATSENHGIAWSRSPVYKHLALALTASVEVAYAVSRRVAERTRCLLAEYGPDDSLQDTAGRGVASYVEFAKTHSERAYAYCR